MKTKAPKWTAMTDAPPWDHDEYIVYGPDFGVTSAHFGVDGFEGGFSIEGGIFCRDYIEPTHWMPLPDPPEGFDL